MLNSHISEAVVLLLGVAMICSLARTAPAQDSPSTLPPPDKSPYGVCQRQFYPEVLAKFREAGIQWITFGVEWNAHEMTQGAYTWNNPNHRLAKVGRYLPVLAEGGMKPLMLVVNPPAWAQERARAENPGAPERRWQVRLEDYTRFVDKLLDTCAQAGVAPAAWMMTNESPTGGTFYDRDPRYWIDFYKASYNLLKKRYPNVPVLMDGMWGVDMHHLEELYGLGLNKYFDVANFHYYAEETNEAQALGWGGQPGWSRYLTPRPVQVSVNDLAFQLEYMHRVMKKHNDVKPIWITECGWREQTEAQKAQYLIDTLDICRRSGVVERFFWYIGSENDHMALFCDPDMWKWSEGFQQRWDEGVTPAYFAYQAYTRKYPTWPMKRTIVNHIRPASRGLEIPDGAFEKPSSWQDVVYDGEVKHSGKSAARLDSRTPERVSSAEITVPCEEQRAYLLTGWMKVKESAGAAEQDGRRRGQVFHAQFDVWMHTWARRGPAIGNYFVADTSGYPDGGWRRISAPIVTTPGTQRMTIRLSCWFGPGTAWFDDLKIEPLDIPYAPLKE